MKKPYLVRTIILAGSLLLQLSPLCFQSRGAAGDVDLSFDAGSGVDGLVKAFVVQPDGKMIIGGQFATVKGLKRNGIARLNADGSGDATFNANAEFIRNAGSVALQTDGKVLVGHDRSRGITRLNSNGSLDTNFVAALDNSDPSPPYSIALQSDGKILIGNSAAPSSHPFRVDGTNIVSPIIRLQANGSLDTSFKVATSSGWTWLSGVYAMALQPDGKVLIGGAFTYFSNGTKSDGIARLNADGTRDGVFNPDATGNNPSVSSVVLQADGKILIGGSFETVNGTSRNRIARLNSNGSLDSSFNPGQPGSYYNVASLVVQPDGKVLVRGYYGYYTTNVNSGPRTGFARLNVDGSLDGAFNPGVEDAWPGGAITLQLDGKVLIGVGGTLFTVNGTNCNSIARLNADGTLDGSFNPGVAINGGLSFLGEQPDGKVLLGVSIRGLSYLGGTVHLSAPFPSIRLNGDGSLDSTFIPTNAPPFPADINIPGSDVTVAECRATQPDGKVLIGGYSYYSYVDPDSGEVTAWTQYFLTRFNADASLDSFQQAFGDANYNFTNIDSVAALAVQPDGKVLLAHTGGFKRFDSNGTPDTNFIANVGSVRLILLQPDGKILVAGGFAYVNGTNRGGIARLHANGSLDNSFDPGTGAEAVDSVALQPDGKLLIAGNFTNVNGTNRNRIARLNANGSLDSSFNPGTGADEDVRSIALQSDGKVLIGGWFTTVNGVLRPHVARLYGDSRPSLNITRSNASVIISWPSPSTGFTLQQNTNSIATVNWSNVLTTPTDNGTTKTVIVNPAAGNRSFRLKSQ